MEHLDELLEYSKNFDCVVLGSGISLNPETGEFVNTYLKGLNRKVVIDADAIKLIDYNNFKFTSVITSYSIHYTKLYEKTFSETSL